MKHKIGILDDHRLVVSGFQAMIEGFADFSVSACASSGAELQKLLEQSANVPDILILDVNMPDMSGAAVARWVNEHYPSIKLVALSLDYNDHTGHGMIEAGCCSYLLKSTHPNELEAALHAIVEHGCYQGESNQVDFRKLKNISEREIKLSPREKEFLPYACADMTYKEIAEILGVAESTVENYRKALFIKFNVRGRVGLAIAAIKRGLVDIDKLPKSERKDEWAL